MLSFSRMLSLSLLVPCLLATACNKPPAPFRIEDRGVRSDRPTPFDPPNTYPGWAYDQPESVRPAKELTPEPPSRPNDPPHYFTNKKIVLVRQPGDYDSEEAPRVAIWWTDNNGFNWNKAGYFSRSQSYFPLEVDEDGDYGIRFVGPGQTAAVHAPAYPERVYHVDTVLPEVTVSVSPEQTWYKVGDEVVISWRAADYHLEVMPVRIAMLMDYTANNHNLIELQRDLADEGTITYQIPPELLNHEATFRVEAMDRAGNLGLAYSYALQVVEEPLAVTQAGTTRQSGGTFEPVVIANDPPAFVPDESSVLTDAANADDNARMPVAMKMMPVREPAGAANSKNVFEKSPPLDKGKVREKKSPPLNKGRARAGSPHRDSRFDPTQSPLAKGGSKPGAPPLPGVGDGSLDRSIISGNSSTETDKVANLNATDGSDVPETESGDALATETMVDIESPGAIPFATAAARVPESDPQLIWHGSKPTPFPSSTATANPREKAVLFDEGTASATVAETEKRSRGSGATMMMVDARPALETRDSGMMADSHARMETNTPVVDPVTMDTGDQRGADAETSSVTAMSLPFRDRPDSPMPAWKRDAPASVDLTHGNDLLIPMPATVAALETRTLWATAHPWRVLGEVWSSPIRTVWSLPNPRLNFGWKPVAKGRFLADHPMLRTVSEPAGAIRMFVGAPAETVDALPAPMP